MADIIAEIKKNLKEGKLVLGADETLKGVRTGKFAKVYLAANCPSELKDDIDHYASMSGLEVVDTGVQNDELGDICKKPFSIAVMGLKK
ncbi:ribosomal L7Ae/L30e/S12e/Gadd45 family protein [Candidatus Woesearchaeota archaeon]|nr:ribosomal L7Ae/L30e/S12e/Gadd45 family protein [Candidatus Woesearchaeota archaeon]